MLERAQRGESSPSIADFERRLDLRPTRIKQLIGQLVGEGIVARVPGSHRNLVVRDVSRARGLCVSYLLSAGAAVAQPLGQMQYPCPNGQLAVFPGFKHLPDP